MKISIASLLSLLATTTSSIANASSLRNLADGEFAQQVQLEKQSDTIAGLEDNGDASTVDIVDTVAGDTALEDTMEEQAETLELANEEENDTTFEDEQLVNRRKFLRYEPSLWEEQWVDEIDDIMEAKSICRSLMGTPAQLDKLHDFMEVICSAGIADPINSQMWCYYHDQNHFMWYNTANRDEFELYVDVTPPVMEGVEPPPVMPVVLTDDHWEHITSRFVFYDEFAEEEYVEYIEPLVGTLRFPLAECIADQPLLADVASFVIPPPSLERTDGRRMLFDIGSPNWSRMQFVVEEWAAHDIEFDDIITYASSRAGDDFPQTVPAEHQESIYREYMDLVDYPVPDKDKVFLPTKIHEMAKSNDYVVLKLDRANAKLKEGIVNYLLQADRELCHVDELILEIDTSDNFLFQKYFDAQLKFDELSSTTMGDTYRMLSDLRQKGIRAHAWI